MKKHLLTALVLVALLFIFKPQDASAQRGGGHSTPPDPNNVHLINLALNTTGYGGTNVGELHLYENLGPSGGSPFFSAGLFTGVRSTLNLYSFEQHVPGFGGPYNDRTASVSFSGDCVGTYTFYDSQDGSIFDDYCRVTVNYPPPTGKSYYVWNLEQSYSDDYVTVQYFHVNGLNGKVSLVDISKR